MEKPFMYNEPKILVVGGGAAGLACALACARKGLRVSVIDRRPER